MMNAKSMKNIALFLAILVAPNVIPRASFMKMFVVRLAAVSLLASLMLESNMEIIIAIASAAILIALLQKREGFMLGPDTDVMNACHDIKYQDILDKFEGDEDKLKAVLHDSAHCPRNILYNDDYAGLMATHLANYDPCVYNFGGDCALPHEQH